LSYDFVAGDTGSKLRVTIYNKNTGGLFDLTDCTVKIRWFDIAGTEVLHDMIIASAVSGVAEYQFTEGELYAPMMSFEIKVTDSTGGVLTSLEVSEVRVRTPLPA
jgi:hypothetical protein